jgi:uncharacterized membrane protein/YHS domain-containing protein
MRHSTRRKPVTILLLMFGAAAAPLSLVRASQPAVNEWCPVMTEEKADPTITTVHRGKTVAFCCDTCLKKFLANPAKYEGRLPQFATVEAAAPGVAGGIHERDHADSDVHGKQEDHGHADPSVGQDAHGHDHDHAAARADSEREPLLGRLHPAIVHFPLAGLPLALLGFLVWLATGREAFARADVPPLIVATLAAVAAVVTGNIAHDAMRFSESLQVIVERRQFASTTVMVIAICLSGCRLWRWNRLTGGWRWTYGCGLLLASGLLGYTGYLGGSLVFGPDHLAW